MDSKVNDEFRKWLNDMYGSYGEVTATRGNVHEYLGMQMIFKDGELKINMKDYVKEMLAEFPVKFKKGDKAPNPATADMFKEDTSKKLNEQEKEIFHHTVAKALFLCKRARLDIQPIVAVLCTRVKAPGRNDWIKLVRMLKYLNGTIEDELALNADNAVSTIQWYVDASFAVHPDFKSHTGAIMKFYGGKGAVEAVCAKQKLNTASSTTAELVAVDDALPMILWTPLFLEEQGYEVYTTLYQDNKSAILLEENGKKSSGRRTRALNVRYFMITDQVEKGTVEIKYCPTDDMIGDYMSKGLQGVKFDKFRKLIMGDKQ